MPTTMEELLNSLSDEESKKRIEEMMSKITTKLESPELEPSPPKFKLHIVK